MLLECAIRSNASISATGWLLIESNSAPSLKNVDEPCQSSYCNEEERCLGGLAKRQQIHELLKNTTNVTR